LSALKEYIELLRKNDILTDASAAADHLSEEVRFVTYDSRLVKPGTLFICKGSAFKKEYLIEAMKNGAIAFVSEKDFGLQDQILVRDVRRAMPYLGEFFFGSPEKSLKITGITGTKGKSTTAYYLKAIIDDWLLDLSAKESAIISSIDVYDGKSIQESHITTPESLMLMEHFRNAVDSGIDYLTMEVSSQALKYNRVDLINFDVGVFLNISEDHISPIEHPDFDDYFKSKLKIFEQTDHACINRNSDHFDEIRDAANTCKEVTVFGVDFNNGGEFDQNDCDLLGYDVRKSKEGFTFRIKTDSFDEEFDITMPGSFNVENALAAAASALSYGIPLKYIKSGLHRARSKGRMELFKSKDGKIRCIVDYAHNKLSFERLYGAVRAEYPESDIIAIFGCPGNKAQLRRKDLPNVVNQYAKKAYIVAEDPGEEPVDKISNEIASNLKIPYEIIEDRGEAIEKAISEIKNPTVILITGKGDETRQKYGRKYIDCESDAKLTEKFIKNYDMAND